MHRTTTRSARTFFSDRLGILLFLAAALATITVVSHAQWGGWEYGCWICVDDNQGGSWPDEECLQVGNSSHGDGIMCREGRVGRFGKACLVSGGGCFNVNSGGGSGGGPGGPFDDDPSECTIVAGSICPASCSSCTVEWGP